MMQYSQKTSTPPAIAFYHGKFAAYVRHTKSRGHSTSHAVSKLSKFSELHLVELSMDIHDELERRSDPRCVPGEHLPSRADIHPKRNHARYQIGELSQNRFADMCQDLVAEHERRWPALRDANIQTDDTDFLNHLATSQQPLQGDSSHPYSLPSPTSDGETSSLMSHIISSPTGNGPAPQAHFSHISEAASSSHNSVATGDGEMSQLKIQNVSTSSVIPTRSEMIEDDDESANDSDQEDSVRDLKNVLPEVSVNEDISHDPPPSASDQAGASSPASRVDRLKIVETTHSPVQGEMISDYGSDIDMDSIAETQHSTDLSRNTPKEPLDAAEHPQADDSKDEGIASSTPLASDADRGAPTSPLTPRLAEDSEAEDSPASKKRPQLSEQDIFQPPLERIPSHEDLGLGDNVELDSPIKSSAFHDARDSQYSSDSSDRLSSPVPHKPLSPVIESQSALVMPEPLNSTQRDLKAEIPDLSPASPIGREAPTDNSAHLMHTDTAPNLDKQAETNTVETPNDAPVSTTSEQRALQPEDKAISLPTTEADQNDKSTSQSVPSALASTEHDVHPNALVDVVARSTYDDLLRQHEELKTQYTEQKNVTGQVSREADQANTSTDPPAPSALATNSSKDVHPSALADVVARSTYDDLLRQHEELKTQHMEQRNVTDQVRREASLFLDEMRKLTERQSTSHDLVEKLTTDVKNWKLRYAAVAADAKRRNSDSGIDASLNISNIDRSVWNQQGLVDEAQLLHFSTTVKKLVVGVRQTPENVLGLLHAVVMATWEVAPNPGSSTPQTDLSDAPRDVVAQAVNQLISVVRNFSVTNGVLSTILVDAAASDVCMAVIEFVEKVGIKKVGSAPAVTSAGSRPSHRRQASENKTTTHSKNKKSISENVAEPVSLDAPVTPVKPLARREQSNGNAAVTPVKPLSKQVPTNESVRNTEENIPAKEVSTESVVSEPANALRKPSIEARNTNTAPNPRRSSIESKLGDVKPVSAMRALKDHSTEQPNPKSSTDGDVREVPGASARVQSETCALESARRPSVDNDSSATVPTSSGLRRSLSRPLPTPPGADSTADHEPSEPLPTIPKLNDQRNSVRGRPALNGKQHQELRFQEQTQVIDPAGVAPDGLDDSSPASPRQDRSAKPTAASPISKVDRGDINEPEEEPKRRPITPRVRPEIPADSSIEELQAYLEEKTSGTVESIGAMLSGIRDNVTVGELQPNIGNIVMSVDRMIAATSTSMKQTRNGPLRDKGGFILENLRDCLDRMNALREELGKTRENAKPPRQLKQRLAGVSFDMAKSTKELVKTVEEVGLTSEVKDIDAQLE